MQIAIGIFLIIAAVFLVVAVLMQSGKSKNLSGAIAGGADTFFGKSKEKTKEHELSKATTIVAIVFVVLVLVSYLMQDTADLSNLGNVTLPSDNTEETGDNTQETTDGAEENDENEAEGEGNGAEA